ncbi:MAG: hypothetical protein E7302_06975 [Butyrivibrio sp.]|nr:hypothetical protein [Butyrivibrio sp.]
MKKKIRFTWIPGALVAIAIIMVVAVIVVALKHSSTLREFKVDMFVLCNESNICSAEGHDGTVRVDSENLQALYAIIYSTRGKYTTGNPDAEDNVTFEFDCHDEKWLLNIEKINDDLLRLTLDGTRSYKLYLRNMDKYNTILDIASAAGYKHSNKLLKQK